MIKTLNMKTTEILNRFNNEGIFPTDSELQIILDERGTPDESIYELEMDLLEIAEKDENHPYYPMTTPKEMSEEEKKIMDAIFGNIE